MDWLRRLHMPEIIATGGGYAMLIRGTNNIFAEQISAENRLGPVVGVTWDIGCAMSTC